MQFKESHKFNTIKEIISILLIFFFVIGAVSTVKAQNKKYVVVLDAGHGGHDPGNLGNGYREKNIALKVVLALGKELKKDPNIRVIFTRNSDVFVELYNRAKIANKSKADLFISVHCDSHTNNAYGAGTFVLGLRGNRRNLEIAKRENSVILLEKDYKKNYDYDPNSPESMIGLSFLQEENLDKSLAIAAIIQHNFTTKLKRRDRKVKQDNFLVLRNTVMPSVLIELGFLTNKKEGRYLNSKKGQQQMATQIANSVKTYINRLQLNTVAVKPKSTVIKKNIVKNTPKGVVFKVQIASGSHKLATKSYNFKGLTNVQRVKIGNSYKYYYGVSTTYAAAKKALVRAKEKGYTTAFIVAFQKGKKISVSKALKM